MSITLAKCPYCRFDNEYYYQEAYEGNMHECKYCNKNFKLGKQK